MLCLRFYKLAQSCALFSVPASYFPQLHSEVRPLLLGAALQPASPCSALLASQATALPLARLPACLPRPESCSPLPLNTPSSRSC